MPKPATTYLPSTSLYSFPRCSTTVSSFSSPAPELSARSLLGSAGSPDSSAAAPSPPLSPPDGAAAAAAAPAGLKLNAPAAPLPAVDEPPNEKAGAGVDEDDDDAAAGVEPNEKPEDPVPDAAVDPPKENELAGAAAKLDPLAAGAPNENAGGLDPPAASDVVADEDDAPKLNPVDGLLAPEAGAVDVLLPENEKGAGFLWSAGTAAFSVPMENVGAGEAEDPDDDPPNPKENALGAAPLAEGVPGVAVGLAPPNDRDGLAPPGPNLPSLTDAGGESTDGFSSFLDGVNVLLSGVVGCKGALGPKLNMGLGLAGVLLVDVEAAFEPDSTSSSDLPAMTSSTSLVTSTDGFEEAGLLCSAGFEASLERPADAADAVEGLAPNENGDEDEAAGTEGTKPLPAGAVPLELANEEDPEPRRAKPPTFGGAGMLGAAAAEDPAVEVAGAGAALGGSHPADLPAASRCFAYCDCKREKTSSRLMKGSSSITSFRNETMPRFRPRRDVQYWTSPSGGGVDCDGAGAVPEVEADVPLDTLLAEDAGASER